LLSSPFLYVNESAKLAVAAYPAILNWATGIAALADAREHLAQLSLDFISDVAVLLEQHLAEANESTVVVLWGRFSRRPATLVEVGERVSLLPSRMSRCC
jgi:hypothetical protein